LEEGRERREGLISSSTFAEDEEEEEEVEGGREEANSSPCTSSSWRRGQAVSWRASISGKVNPLAKSPLPPPLPPLSKR
jgi:hypothetical protein